MKYELIPPRTPLIEREDNVSVPPLITRLYIRAWHDVLRVLSWTHGRRLDFVLTVDPQGQGWKMEIQQPGHNYLDIEQILQGAGVNSNGRY